MELTKADSCHKENNSFPCGKICIKCVTLNVSGLNNKLNNGILDQYLANFDIILLVETNCESPNLQNTLLNDFTSVSKKKVKLNRKYKYGGIHGICALLSPDLKDAVDLSPDTKSEYGSNFILLRVVTVLLALYIYHVTHHAFTLKRFSVRLKMILSIWKWNTTCQFAKLEILMPTRELKMISWNKIICLLICLAVRSSMKTAVWTVVFSMVASQHIDIIRTLRILIEMVNNCYLCVKHWIWE